MCLGDASRSLAGCCTARIRCALQSVRRLKPSVQPPQLACRPNYHKENTAQSPLHPHATRSRGVLQGLATTPVNAKDQEDQLLVDFAEMSTA